MRLLPAYKGFTGVHNTPSAFVLPASEGAATWGYTGHNRMVAGLQSVGSFLEIGGTIIGRASHPGDLGLNAKWSLPAWERNDYSLALAFGGVDIGGGRVMDRHGYGVGSLRLSHAMLDLGWTTRNKPLAAFEVEPGVSWVRMQASLDGVGLVAVAPNWGHFLWAVNPDNSRMTWQLAAQRSFEDFPDVPALPTQWNLHYTPNPYLFDVVAVETGPYHYQLSIDHELRLRGIPHLFAAMQVRQPLHHSHELDEGNSLSRFRDDGVRLQQSVVALSANHQAWGAQWGGQGALGTYAKEWWFWRAQATASWHNFDLQGYFAYFDNRNLGEYRTVWVPSASWHFLPNRYTFKVWGGEFWEQDRAVGTALVKHVGSVDVSLHAEQVFSWGRHDHSNLIGATLSMPLSLPQDLQTAHGHLSANGPYQWKYGLRTRLITPGHRNTVYPLAATEPEWLE